MGNVKQAATGTWESRRYLLRADGFGFSFHNTIIRAGTSTRIHYKNHVEAVLVTSGSGEIELCHPRQQEGEGFAVFRLGPGSFYGLGGQECHYLRAAADTDMHVSCAFSPPVDGSEDHDSEGVYPAVGSDGRPRYAYSRNEVSLLFRPPESLRAGSGASVAPALPHCVETRLGPVHFHRPSQSDGAPMWELARSSGLDLNSAYCYILHCAHFAETCLVAKSGSGEVVGFVMGHRPDGQQDTYFVWQIAVGSEWRRCDLARRMLEVMRRRLGVAFLTASVTPDNAASRRLFQSFAESSGCPLRVDEDWMPSSLFPPDAEGKAEHLHVIGPFQ